jgi:acetolactate synthase small subunit
MQHAGTVPEDVPMNPGSVEGQHPEGRDIDEATETMRARLVYLSRKRGILEMEMLLSTFIKDSLKTMTREEMQEYDRVGAIALARVPF